MSKKAANYGIAVSVVAVIIVAFIGGFYFSESKSYLKNEQERA